MVTRQTSGDQAGSLIRNLVINNFATGIFDETGDNIVIAGNYIGTDATGSTPVPNQIGLNLNLGSFQVGGLSGLTTGACPGDCNLISANSQTGIQVDSYSGGLIEGNFIGTDASGMSAVGNEDGIATSSTGLIIGGTAAGAGNVISGNNLGIFVGDSVNNTPTIEGNYWVTPFTTTAARYLSRRQPGQQRYHTSDCGHQPAARHCLRELHRRRLLRRRRGGQDVRRLGDGERQRRLVIQRHCKRTGRHRDGNRVPPVAGRQHVRVLHAVGPAGDADSDLVPNSDRLGNSSEHRLTDSHAHRVPNADSDAHADTNTNTNIFANGSAQWFSSVYWRR